MKPIYLDYNATTPLDPKVIEAMLPFLHEHFGNPSSSHSYGMVTKQAVEKARGQVAAMLHCDTSEVVFTSGGSESNNMAIKGAAFALRDRGNHLITSAVEHPAVLEVCRFLETKGFEVTVLPVDGFGCVDPQQVEAAITPRTILISIMHANNEVGSLQPIEAIAAIARRRGVWMHTDAAQSVGKVPVTVDALGVDMLSIAGHKLYAPKGVGALYVRSGVHLEKLVHGAGHESNWRAGTENVLQVVGLGEACALVEANLPRYAAAMRSLRDRLEAGLASLDIRVNGHPERRLPNTSSVSFKGLAAGAILSDLVEDVAASAGSACHSDHVDLSPVLKAMQVPLEYAMGTVRFSVGRFTTEAEIDRAVACLIRVVSELRGGGS